MFNSIVLLTILITIFSMYADEIIKILTLLTITKYCFIDVDNDNMFTNALFINCINVFTYSDIFYQCLITCISILYIYIFFFENKSFTNEKINFLK